MRSAMRGIRKLHAASCVYCREAMPHSADIVAPDGSQWGEGKAAAHRLCAARAKAEGYAVTACARCHRTAPTRLRLASQPGPLCDVCFGDWYAPDDEGEGEEFDVFDGIEDGGDKFCVDVTTKPPARCRVCSDGGKRYWWDGEGLREDVCDCLLNEWGAKR